MVCSLFSRQANAFGPFPDLTPAMPFSSQFCASCIPGSVATVRAHIKQIPQIKKELQQVTSVSNLKQLAKSYATNLGKTAFNALRAKLSARNKIVDFSMVIEECTKQNIDVDDPKSIQKGFITLFLEYPSEKNNIMQAYKRNGDQLKIDKAVEAYVTTVELAKKMYGSADNTPEAAEKEGEQANNGTDLSELGLVTQLNYVEECLLSGNQTDDSGSQKISEACRKTGLEDCSGTGDTEAEKEKEDKMCLWRNAVLAARLYEQFMIYNEYLMAMMGEYNATNGINNKAFIRNAKDSVYGTGKEGSGQKDSSLLTDQIKSQLNKTKAIRVTNFSVYADKEIDDIFRRYEQNLQSSEKVKNGDFEALDKAEGLTSPVDGKEEDFALLEKIAQINDNVDKAMEIHNMKQNLPTFRRVFKSYDKAQKYHDAMVERLETSGKCIQNFLEPYYATPNVIWFGKNCNYYKQGKIYCHYSQEKVKSAKVEGESQGLFDIICPDDNAHLCFVQKLTDTPMDRGVSGYLMNLYQTVKDNQATGEVKAFIETTEEKTSEDAYTSRVSINIVEQGGGDSLSYKESNETDEFAKAEWEEEQNTSSTIVTRETTDKRKENKNKVKKSVFPQLSEMRKKAAPANATEGNHEKDHKVAEEEKLEMRKNALLNWTIGAEVSKDIANDLVSSHPVFGTVEQSFPIWNDQKEFYDQYIDYKYENIRKYVQKEPFAEALYKSATSVNRVFPYKDIVDGAGHVIKTITQQRQEVQSEIDKFKTQVQGVSVSNKIEDTFKATEKAIALKRQAWKQELESLQQAIENKKLEIDELGKKLSIANRVFNNQQRTLERAESTKEHATEGEIYNKNIYKNVGRTLDVSASPQNKFFTDTKKKQQEAEDNANQTLTRLEYEMNPERIEARMNKAKAELEAMKDSLRAKRQNYVLAISDLEEDQRIKMLELMEEPEEEDHTIQQMILALVEKNTPAGLAAGVMECVRQQAVSAVDKAKRNLDAMKSTEALYYSSASDQILDNHKEMINKIQAVKLSEIADCLTLGNFEQLGIQDDLEKLLTDALTMYKSICDNVQCTTPDDRYFVGITPKKDDFRAPRTPLDVTSAPLREVVHFDIEDYHNVDKKILDDDNLDDNRNVIITKESIRDSGIDLPEVWKAILSDHAYVERDVDLGKLLGNTNKGSTGIGVVGDPEKALVRGGVFPCRQGTKVIDINKSFQYTNETAKDQDFYQMPECNLVTGTDKRILDKETNYATSSKGNDAKGTILKNSELGHLFAYIPDKEASIRALLPNGLRIASEPEWEKVKHRLTFNNVLQKAYNHIKNTKGYGDSAEEDFRYNSSNRTFMGKNQFGDYLNFVEAESKAADSMAELNEKIEEVKDTLASIFYDTGYEMSEDFSLLNPADYEKAAEVLDKRKESYLKLAEQQLSENGIQATSSSQSFANAAKTQYIQKKISKLLHKWALLAEIDTDEFVVINGDEEYDEVKQAIEEQKANENIAEEYDVASEASYAEQIKKLQQPLCVSYIKPTSSSARKSPTSSMVSTDANTVKQKAQAIEIKSSPIVK